MKVIVRILYKALAIVIPLNERKYFLLTLGLIIGTIFNACAANVTWTNGGGTNLWTTASNWSTGSVPASNSTVIFSATYPYNCTINTQVSINGMTIQASYTGTITQGSTDSIVLSGNYSQSAGTFTGSGQNIYVDGGWTLAAGTFTSTSSNLFVEGNMSITSGAVFNSNSGTVYFDLAGNTTVTVPTNGSIQFNNVTFNSSVGSTVASGDTMVVAGTLSLLQNQVKTGTIRLISGSSIVTNVAFTGGNGVLDIQAPLTITPLCATFCGVDVDNSSAVFNAPAFTFTINGALNVYSGTFNGGPDSIWVNGIFKQTGGTFNATSGTMIFGSSFSYTAGTFNNNSGTIEFNNASNSTLTNGGLITFYNAILNTTATKLTLSATDTLKTSGTLTLTEGTMNGGDMVPGTGISIGSNYAGGTTVMLLINPSTYTIPAGMNIPATTVNNSSAIVSFASGSSPVFIGAVKLLSGTFNCNSTQWAMTQALTISGGTFNATTDTIKYSNAALTISTGATFNHNNGTISFMSSANSTTVTNSLKTYFYNVIINLTNATKASAELAVTAGDTIVAVNSLTLQAGYFNSGILQLEGNLNDLGSFGGGAGVLYIANGTGARDISLESPNFCGIALNDVNAEVDAPDANTLSVGGVFTLAAGDFFPDVYYMTFTANYTQTGGTFWQGDVKEIFSGLFTLNGGTFYATSDTLELDGATITMANAASGAVFNHNNGQVFLNRSTAGTTFSTAQKILLYNLIINLTNATPANAALKVTGGDTIAVTNSLILGVGNISSGIVEVMGTGTVNDLGNFGGGAGFINFGNGSGSRTINFSSATIPGLQLNDINVTVVPSGTQAVTVVGAVTVTNGILSAGSYPVTFNSTYTQGGGTLATASVNEYFVGAVSVTGGAFNASSDTTIFETTTTFGASAIFSNNIGTINCTNATANFTLTVPISFTVYNFYVNFPNATNNTLTISTGDTVIVKNQLTLMDGKINTGYVELEGSIQNATSFNGGTATVFIANGGSARSITLPGETWPVLVLNDANATINGPTSGTFSLQGAMTVKAGTFTGGAGTVSIGTTYTQSGGAVNAGAGGISVGTTYTQSGGTFTGGGGNVTVTGNYSLSAGTFTGGSGITTLSGNYTQSGGTFAAGSGNVILAGSYSQTLGTFTGSTGNLEVATNFAISGTGTVFTAPSDTLSVAGTFTITSPATFNHNNGLLYFTGATGKTLTSPSALTLGSLSVALTSGAALSPNNALTITGNLTIGSAAYLSQSTSGINISLAGSFNDLNTGGGLLYGTKTFTFNGSSAQSISGANGLEQFYNLVMSNTSGGVNLTGTDVYVNKLLTLTPASGVKVIVNTNNLIIDSTASISGGTSTEFVVTGGGGYLEQQGLGPLGRSGSVVFPVGISSSDYTPVTMLNTGTDDRYDVSARPTVLSAGNTGYAITQFALNQTYFLREQNEGGSNVTLTLQWNASDELPGFDRTNMIIKHYHDNYWNDEGTYGAASGSGPYSRSVSGVTSFCPWGGGSGDGGDLPIQLVSFTGFLDGSNNVQLDWSTQIEINNDYFTIERSSDGENFTEIAKVDGAGNSTLAHDYTLNDEHPLKGTNYYRLEQTDFDGNTAQVGNTVAVSVTTNTTDPIVSIYPNPLEGRELTLSMTGIQQPTGNTLVTVTDLSGKNVYSGVFGAATLTNISLPSDLAQGMYLVKVNSGGKDYNQKLMVK